MWEQWGVEFLAFLLTWHIAYTIACCHRTNCDLVVYLVGDGEVAAYCAVFDCLTLNK